MYLTDSTMTST